MKSGIEKTIEILEDKDAADIHLGQKTIIHNQIFTFALLSLFFGMLALMEMNLMPPFVLALIAFVSFIYLSISQIGDIKGWRVSKKLWIENDSEKLREGYDPTIYELEKARQMMKERHEE